MADSEPLSPPAPFRCRRRRRPWGSMLRTARLAQDLTLEQLSTELRIEAKQLNALEENRFERIGVPVFVKGYLKQYGQRLGVDVAICSRSITSKRRWPTSRFDRAGRSSCATSGKSRRGSLRAIVLLLVVVGLAVWWWNGGSFAAIPFARSTPAPATTSAPAAADATPPSSPPVEQSVAPSPSAACRPRMHLQP